ncbi:efflux RND transporter periplasmic adaptor subunit [Niallia sp. NCCP-28]|uniref:HlyD family efflux transporter periplasmic adaptor subunit n=1 Tax=Niallia sp. NCCP-28 TaxID=2934712 RepID=UPI00208086A4|nr:efflux RND transporter periplasmic adaptor subunit [Niallia sp. NCCP-28]GKU83438.1 transporter [Niallia sp. NCCP-28]
MKGRKFLLVFAIALFLGVNIILLQKKEHHFDQTTFVSSWTKAAERDLIKTMQKQGISLPADRQAVYYDSTKGNFAGFLVQKGEYVEQDTPLLSYTNSKLQESISSLQLEVERLEKEEGSLETQINQLYSIQQSLLYSEENSNVSVSTSIEKDIAEKEQELAKTTAMLEKNQALMQLNEEKSGEEAELSTISGYVESIQEDLKNPIITIVSSDQKVEGLLKEKERNKLAEGMEVTLKDQNKRILTGTVVSISALPKGKTTLNSESYYPFTININEQSEELIAGTHYDMEIITEKIENAITVPKKSVKVKKDSQYVYTIEKGLLNKKAVNAGAIIGGFQQIEEGLDEKEVVILPTINNKMYGNAFITPIKVKQWSHISTENRRKKDMFRYMLKGFL